MHISVSFGSALGAIFSLDFMVGGPNTWFILVGLPAVFGLYIKNSIQALDFRGNNDGRFILCA